MNTYNHPSSEEIIQKLKLIPHSEEGGHFRETYRSSLSSINSSESAGTCIFYLLTEKDISTWHKVKKDEIWLYHAGTPGIQILLLPDGSWEERIIGPDIANGNTPQSIIPAGTWQSTVLSDRSRPTWGLFGAVVIPGFEFADYIPGNGKELMQKYPGAANRIKELGLD